MTADIDLEMVRGVLRLPLTERAGWGTAILADVWREFVRIRHGTRLDHVICIPKLIRPRVDVPAVSVLPLDVARANFEAAQADLMRVACSKPPALTYARLQGRLCAEEAFLNATDDLHKRPGRLTFDDHIEAWGDLVELMLLKVQVSPELGVFVLRERFHWLDEAIGTVIDRARCFLLGPPGRAHFAPRLHDNIGVLRLFLISRDYRRANSFDDLIYPHP